MLQKESGLVRCLLLEKCDDVTVSGKILIQRDEETALPKLFYSKLPQVCLVVHLGGCSYDDDEIVCRISQSARWT